ncbi:MAG: DUF2380 domain-containing protein [Gammaproteobacteria bacterium]|nr:DUF2380 domain-containing protein [Gammaproteobacteria bacterium]
MRPNDMRPNDMRRLADNALGRTGRVAVLLLASMIGASALADTRSSVAVLGVELIDTSPAVTQDRERARLQLVQHEIRQQLTQHGYPVIDAQRTEQLVRGVRQSEYLHQCNGCELELGAELSADWVLIGWIQKVSNLILNLNVVVLDVRSGADVAAGFVDLRGNTDESWRRATRYLMTRIVLKRMQLNEHRGHPLEPRAATRKRTPRRNPAHAEDGVSPV